MKKLLLHDFHQSNGARFISEKNWKIPADYGDVNSELQAIKNNVALLDRSYLGKVRLRGSDGIDLINRISTNDMTRLLLETVCDTVFSTPKGRIVDYCRVLHLEPDNLIISSYIDCGHIIEWLNRFIIMEDVEVIDSSDEFIWLTLLGPESIRFIQSLTKQEILGSEEAVWVEKFGINFPILQNNNLLVPAYNFCLPVRASFELLDWLNEELKKFNGCLIGNSAFQITRVESGMPDWGTELTDDYNPHEARLLSAVSFTKGCYTGQEVIARLDTYDKVQKYLMIVEMTESINVRPPLNIFLDDDKIGIVTSYAFDPLSKRHIGLGYVKKMYAIDDLNMTVDVDLGERRVAAGLRIPPTR